MGRVPERVTSRLFVPKWVWHEHLARYTFAARYVKGQAVIDCACGDGTSSEMFAKAGAVSVEAFDTSEAIIRAAQARCTATNLRFRIASALNLPLPNAYADVYISLETIEHLDDDRAFLADARRLLKPDGLFICSTPNRTVTNPGATLGDPPWNRFHVREYSQEELRDLLGTAFDEVELFGLNPVRLWKARVMERLGTRLPRHGAVRLNQMLKLPRLVCDRLDDHAVRPLQPGCVYEYLVAVCRHPKDARL